MLLRFLHIILSLLLFFSSAGVVVNQHFCQGELKTVGLYVKAKSCDHSTVATCTSKKNCCEKSKSIEEDNCCHDEAVFIQMDEDLKQTFYTFQTTTIDFVAVLPVVLKKALPSISLKEISYINYHPPPMVRDIYILIQSFLC